MDIALKNIEIQEWLPKNDQCKKNTYGLRVVGLSMLPNFMPDDRIYVDPNYHTESLKTGDLVVVACDGDVQAIFRKLIIEGNNRYLQPLNPDWPDQITKLTNNCRIIGKVTGLFRKI